MYNIIYIEMCRIDLFYFGSISVRFFEKNSDSVRNEFGSVRFLKNFTC